MSLFPKEDAQAIAALRQQIIANASVLFPKVVKGKHNTLFRWGHPSADVLFEVAIVTVNKTSGAQADVGSTEYQAILTHGLIEKTSTAAAGNHAATVYAALESLLLVTAHELAERKCDNVAYQDISSEANFSPAGGFVDRGLFQQKKKSRMPLKSKK